jgi:hypothetical protein
MSIHRIAFVAAKTLLVLVSAVVALAIAQSIAAAPLNFLCENAVDPVSLLSAPPSARSDEGRAELDSLLAIQAKRTPQQVARCRAEIKLGMSSFRSVMEPWFTAENLPKLDRLLKQVEKDSKCFLAVAKKHFHRPRPAQEDNRICWAVEPEDTPAYPSGHATCGLLSAMILAELVPERRAALLERGREIGWDRVVAGAHHTSDIVAGRVLGLALWRSLCASPKFQAALAEARAEFNDVKHRHQPAPQTAAHTYQVTEDDRYIHIEMPDLTAAICKKGYVSGVANQSLLDKSTGFRDPGFGLDIADWIMEPGSDATYRDRLPAALVYRNDGDSHLYHGSRPKRSIEGPQICTQAGQLRPSIIRGKDFVAIRQQFTYHLAAPGKQVGSRWTQLLVFPLGKRYFISMDKIEAVNPSEAMFLRIDMPGHVRHTKGDTFSEIYLSYCGRIPASQFCTDFPPDTKFDYLRGRDPVPDRFMRGYRLRDPTTGKDGPWLVGMTLEPSVVSEAWCHQRGYVCMIEEFGGRRIRPGQSFSTAFIVGYFDTIEEMQRVYDAHKGHTAIETSAEGWKLTK